MSEVDKISALGNAAIERSRERRRPIGTKSVALRRQHLYKKLGRVLVAGGIVLIGAALFGALIVGVFNSGLRLAGVDVLWQVFAIGWLIIIAVAIDQWIRKVSA